MAKEKSNKTYKELEDDLKKVLEKLSDENLPLDESRKYYLVGKDLITSMEKKIEELEKEVTNTIKEE